MQPKGVYSNQIDKFKTYQQSKDINEVSMLLQALLLNQLKYRIEQALVFLVRFKFPLLPKTKIY